jgi:lysophospholipase L1-like esterase
MVRLLPILFAALIFDVIPLHGDFLIQSGDSIAICGASITERKGYSVFMEDYLLMCQPTQGQTVYQEGWSGEKTAGLLNRLDSDLFPFKPTVVTTAYGINDGGYSALTPAIANRCRTSDTELVEALKSHGVRVIILGSSTYNETLGGLAAIDRDVAAKEGVIYADVFDGTMAAMEKAKALYGASYVFGGSDGVHPGPNGHLVMAYVYLKALGCDGNIGTLTVDLGLDQATGSPGQKITSFHAGVLEVESSRYPFCFHGEPGQPSQDDGSMLGIIPFNQDLNRYMLVVRGLKATKAEITWGTESKEFTAEQLQAGINLAAEFLQNPFMDSFNKVDAAVHAQQSYETVLMKHILHPLSKQIKAAPQKADALRAAAAQGMEHDRALFQAEVALVTPVHHTLTIKPVP